MNPDFYKLRICLFQVARKIRQKVAFLDDWKAFDGFVRFAERHLSPPVGESRAAEIAASLDEGVVARQVAAIEATGHQPEFYVLQTSSFGDIIACEPIARYPKRLSPGATVQWIVRKRFEGTLEGNGAVDEVLVVNYQRTVFRQNQRPSSCNKISLHSPRGSLLQEIQWKRACNGALGTQWLPVSSVSYETL